MGACSGKETNDEKLEFDSLGNSRKDELEERMRKMLRSRPFLNKEQHGLNQYVVQANEDLAAERLDDAENTLITLELEINAEEHAIAAAFQKFDHSGDDVLQGDEIMFMLDYLGFPCSQKDVDELMQAVDTDSDNTVSFDEFIVYVGNIGGSGKLFELRRAQIEARLKDGGTATMDMDLDTLKTELHGAGITEDAFAYWQLTASRSELEQAAMLQPCQRKAVRHIRNLAKENHSKALPALKQRVKAMGYTDVDLHMALAWIRELAPIIVHVKLDKLGEFLLKDDHYRNQFETNTSSGLLKTSARIKWEKGLFGSAYDPNTTKHFDRPKYGVQNIWNDPRGVVGCLQYGESYLVLKDVRLRCTMSPEDSANLPAKKLAVPDYYAHVLQEYSDKELKETLRIAKGGNEELGDSKAVIEKWGKYKEVQIHGPVDLNKHVDRLVVHEKHKKNKDFIEQITAAHNWKLTWIDDMRKELEERKSGVHMDDADWQKKLQILKGAEEQDAAAADYCKKHEAGGVLWSFAVKDGWQIFDQACQEPLESKYQQFVAQGSPKQAEIQLPRRGKVIVDFNSMTQQVKGNERLRNVRREAPDQPQ
jgi:hypothetical protein